MSDSAEMRNPTQRTFAAVILSLEARMTHVAANPYTGGDPTSHSYMLSRAPRSLSKNVRSEQVATPEDAEEIRKHEPAVISWLLSHTQPTFRPENPNHQSFQKESTVGDRVYSAGTELHFSSQNTSSVGDPMLLHVSMRDEQLQARVMLFHYLNGRYQVAVTFRDKDGKARAVDYMGLSQSVDEMSDEEAFLVKELLSGFVKEVAK